MKKTLLALTLAMTGGVCAAQSMYVGLGTSGVSLGGSYGLSDKWALRGEVGVIPTFNRSGTYTNSGGTMNYTGTAGSTRFGVFADYFPFSNNFRFSGGLTFNNTRANLNATSGLGSSITFNGSTYPVPPGYYYNAAVRQPDVTPYLGIGWSSRPKSEKGFGLFADFGLLIGTPKLSYTENLTTGNPNANPALPPLTATSGPNAGQPITTADINKQIQPARDAVNKIPVIPSITIGVSYTF